MKNYTLQKTTKDNQTVVIEEMTTDKWSAIETFEKYYEYRLEDGETLELLEGTTVILTEK